ncbi:MAG: M14 family zinc carboxypeptidase, partial [Sphingomonadales bacterium]
MKKALLLVVLNFLSLHLLGQNKFTPQQFLGYNIGEQFTRHHRVVEYFYALEKAFPENLKVVKTGQTYEKRDLLLCYIGTPENLKKLEEIRQKHLNQDPDEKLAIVWLSYNVHGNESSGTEAAMQTAYRLLTDKIGYLEHTVVIMDPCLNPDGRDRYVNFYYQYGANPIDMERFSASHNETWPGGRPNHYLFDLNRDW